MGREEEVLDRWLESHKGGGLCIDRRTRKRFRARRTDAICTRAAQENQKRMAEVRNPPIAKCAKGGLRQLVFESSLQ
jgi:hypothetical protein